MSLNQPNLPIHQNLTQLPSDLHPELLPQHIAMIMDGNGRWAKQQGWPRIAGHRQGAKTLKNLVRCCKDWGIPTLTAYAFSTENWQRPLEEVNFLMGLFERLLAQELAELCREDVRLSFIGDLARLPAGLNRAIDHATTLTQYHQSVHLVVAINYGGRAEITTACRQIAELVQAGSLDLTAIDEATIAAHLTTQGITDPDLLIRTSQEFRLSNFLPWQSAYTELYFTSILWPDFDRHHFHQALLAYQQRDRRYGTIARSA
jgi:undecaprenyl diphosphate synthase